MERKEVVLVDIFNKPIGKKGKLESHETPCLHRAFSVFLVNDKNEILIQKRAEDKYHSGGKWANACCSHPEDPNQDIKTSAELRLVEELGVSGVELREMFSFIYFAKFNDNLYEYEHDTVLIGKYNGEITLDPTEASEYKWITKDELNKDMVENPEKYSVWFLSCAPRVLASL